MNNQEKGQQELIEKYNRMPPGLQRAVNWWLANLEYVDRLIETDDFTSAELEAAIQQALKKKDYFLYVILLYKQLREEE